MTHFTLREQRRVPEGLGKCWTDEDSSHHSPLPIGEGQCRRAVQAGEKPL